MTKLTSYVCDDYAYFYRNQGQGSKASLSIQIKQALFNQFIKAYWPKYSAAAMHNPASVFHNLLVAEAGSGWIKIECMSDASEPRLKKVIRLMNIYFGARRLELEANAPTVHVVKDGVFVARYAITVSKAFRQTTVVPADVAAKRAQAAGVITSDDGGKPVVDQSKLLALAAKFGHKTFH